MVTKTQYVTVKLTMRQLRYVDALLRRSLEREGPSCVDMTRKERGIINGVEKKLAALVYQAEPQPTLGRIVAEAELPAFHRDEARVELG